jgi:hypothetical protein
VEPSDLAASPWSRREPPCVIHGTGPCPYPVAQWQLVSLSLGEGEGEEEDEATEEEEDDVVVVAVIDKDDESVEVISVPESTSPRSPYNQTVRIRTGPWGRPTETLAPRDGARKASPISYQTGPDVWPPPPPPLPSGPVTTTDERRLEHCTATTGSHHRK